MSGEELDKKLKDAGYVLADIARMLGVPPQSVNQTLNAKDVKTGFLEELCRILKVNMGFFYEIDTDTEVSKLREENRKLKEELTRMSDPILVEKENKVYNIWMKFMEITEEMQELYKAK
jgi:transcriptional regulator with XRE-family HTH domain